MSYRLVANLSEKVVMVVTLYRAQGRKLGDAAEQAHRFGTHGAASGIAQRQPPPNLIVHSDSGSQRARALPQALLARHDLVGNMSRKGNCRNKAVIKHQAGARRAARLRQPPRDHEPHRRRHRGLLQQRAAALQTGQLTSQYHRATIANQPAYCSVRNNLTGTQSRAPPCSGRLSTNS